MVRNCFSGHVQLIPPCSNTKTGRSLGGWFFRILRIVDRRVQPTLSPSHCVGELIWVCLAILQTSWSSLGCQKASHGVGFVSNICSNQALPKETTTELLTTFSFPSESRYLRTILILFIDCSVRRTILLTRVIEDCHCVLTIWGVKFWSNQSIPG